MSTQSHSRPLSRPSLPLVLLAGLLVILWLAGGASRDSAAGQVIVRGAAWAALIVGLLLCRPAFSAARPVWLLLGSMVALALLQLVPLPPDVWQALPGREPFVEAMDITGQAQPWRPWAIVPGGARNAAESLIVPVTTLYLATALNRTERRWLMPVLLSLIGASMLVGLLQFSGVVLNNPFINDTAGEVSGSFANRNHFALFMAFGCLIAPIWAFSHGHGWNWRIAVACGLVPLFVLTILATGSRAGLLLGVSALGIGLLLARDGLKALFDKAARWVLPAIIAGVVAMLAVLVLLSIVADRAIAISRIVEMDPGQDMRSRGLPTVIEMIGTYFPVGSGLGGFDPLFRMHEPFGLLKPTYFNHAHNDFLEILLDAGVPGLLLLLAAVGWWGWASLRAWRGPARRAGGLARLGSAMIFLVLVASVVDYPARTPMIMAVLAMAAVWLATGPDEERDRIGNAADYPSRRSALPRKR
ncbi:O-antigen ligase family protein [Sphingomonas sp. IC4-52]|uniref:O-antigen ligase family protein n=1 Tax=Sphingomonas sp. IC4-52 TaxID=2887202 RepID=UPI001D10E5FB|nr:O-antigen ligase family protein [Sphingomonas sp. IC4-52]MCC2981671.1 O-antigen ligase family protein [Sphingomonas sp. IC4-52]